MRAIGLRINSEKDPDGNLFKNVKKSINKYNENIKIIDLNKYDEKIIEEMDIIIAMGGDGTILSTSRIVGEYDKPIFGINIGNLGFLSSIEYNEFLEIIPKLLNEDYHVEERMMLKCIVKNGDKKVECIGLNDIVVSRGTLSRIVNFEISVDGNHFTNLKGDGVIFSSPTGSTGYALSAGGTIIHPSLSVIQITPICPHINYKNNIILNSNSNIDLNFVNVSSDIQIYLIVDGQENIKLNSASEVKISKSSTTCKLIRINGYNYFNILKNKLIYVRH